MIADGLTPRVLLRLRDGLRVSACVFFSLSLALALVPMGWASDVPGADTGEGQGQQQDSDAPEDIEGVATSVIGASDGKLVGTIEYMEYSKDGGKTWEPCKNGETTGLAAGEYLVRYMASGSAGASSAMKVTISDGPSGGGTGGGDEGSGGTGGESGTIPGVDEGEESQADPDVEAVHVYYYDDAGAPHENYTVNQRNAEFSVTNIAQMSDGTPSRAEWLSYLSYTYWSDNPSTATVDATTGYVRVLDDGIAKINITCTDTRTGKQIGGTPLTLICTGQRDVYVTGLTIVNVDTGEKYGDDTVKLDGPGSTLNLGVIASMSDGSTTTEPPGLSWSTDKSVGVLDGSRFTATNGGQTYVRASCSGGENIYRSFLSTLYINVGTAQEGGSPVSALHVSVVYEKAPDVVVREETFSIAALKQLGVQALTYTQVSGRSSPNNFATVNAQGVLISSIAQAVDVTVMDADHIKEFHLGAGNAVVTMSYSEMFTERYYYPDYSQGLTATGMVVPPMLAVSEHRSVGSDEVETPDNSAICLKLEMGYGGRDLSNISELTIVLPGGGNTNGENDGTGDNKNPGQGTVGGDGQTGGDAAGTGGSGTATNGSSSATGIGGQDAQAAASSLSGAGEQGTGESGTADDAYNSRAYSVWGLSEATDNPTTDELSDNPYLPAMWLMLALAAASGILARVCSFRWEIHPWVVGVAHRQQTGGSV